MLLRQLNIAPRAALGFSLIAVLVAWLGVFALGQMSSIRDKELSEKIAAYDKLVTTPEGQHLYNPFKQTFAAYRSGIAQVAAESQKYAAHYENSRTIVSLFIAFAFWRFYRSSKDGTFAFSWAAAQRNHRSRAISLSRCCSGVAIERWRCIAAVSRSGGSL
ncbi:hypothetical protein [Pseudomonas sp. EA_5y_Pfl2_R50]|uniref:hypothetical protein n=1 Tax=Pseudomonas sp. EA_5y_Pfl2_R50 TaxID=3088691 RepID=UPI0030DB9C9E